MTKNDNELMIEALDNFISVIKKNSSSPERFENGKREVIKNVFSIKKRIGDTDFLTSKEWKSWLIQQKIKDIEKDF